VGGTEQRPPISTRILVTSALKDLLRPPFSLLLFIALLLFVVQSTLVAADPAIGLLAFALAVMSVYLQIAFTLAGASKAPGRSADAWIKAAFKRRCFWRYLVTGLFAVALVAVGALALLVGAFVVGAIVGLAQPAAVLERRNPLEAIRRSAALSRPARVPVGTVFGVLVLIPNVILVVMAQLSFDRDLSPAWNVGGLALVALTVAGTIALARAFVSLGGEEPDSRGTTPPG
jgi:hypothetical protein